MAYYEVDLCTKILPSAMVQRDILTTSVLKKIYSVFSFAEELGMRKKTRIPYCFYLSQIFPQHNLKKQKDCSK